MYDQEGVRGVSRIDTLVVLGEVERDVKLLLATRDASFISDIMLTDGDNFSHTIDRKSSAALKEKVLLNFDDIFRQDFKESINKGISEELWVGFFKWINEGIEAISEDYGNVTEPDVISLRTSSNSSDYKYFYWFTKRDNRWLFCGMQHTSSSVPDFCLDCK